MRGMEKQKQKQHFWGSKVNGCTDAQPRFIYVLGWLQVSFKLHFKIDCILCRQSSKSGIFQNLRHLCDWVGRKILIKTTAALVSI